MRVFNRVVVVLLCLAIIAVAILLLAVPVRVVDSVVATLGAFRNSLADPTFAAITALILAVLALLALLVLVLQFLRRRQPTVRIYAQGRGNARLRVESVAQTLEYRIDELPGVRRVEPHLFSRGKDLSVALDVDAAPDANIPALSDQIIDRTLRILEGELGLQVHGRIRLDISHEPYPIPTPVAAERVSPPPAAAEARAVAPAQAPPIGAPEPEPAPRREEERLAEEPPTEVRRVEVAPSPEAFVGEGPLAEPAPVEVEEELIEEPPPPESEVPREEAFPPAAEEPEEPADEEEDEDVEEGTDEEHRPPPGW